MATLVKKARFEFMVEGWCLIWTFKRGVGFLRTRKEVAFLIKIKDQPFPFKGCRQEPLNY